MGIHVQSLQNLGWLSITSASDSGMFITAMCSQFLIKFIYSLFHNRNNSILKNFKIIIKTKKSKAMYLLPKQLSNK